VTKKRLPGVGVNIGSQVWGELKSIGGCLSAPLRSLALLISYHNIRQMSRGDSMRVRWSKKEREPYRGEKAVLVYLGKRDTAKLEQLSQTMTTTEEQVVRVALRKLYEHTFKGATR